MTAQTTAGSYPCPACRASADLAGGCPGCGRPPDPDAAEVIRLNQVLAELQARERLAYEAHGVVLAELARTSRRRDLLATQVRWSVPPPPVPPPPGPGPPGPGPWETGPATRPEASARGVQAVLFAVGGLLLGVGAIVFTVVAWTRFGTAGQAAILAAGTVLALAAPAVARRRRLPGTAETIAVVGVLLVLLDGYAAWRAGLAGGLPGTTWAGLVCGATAIGAWGYARGVGLTGPRFAALVLMQPVLPLLAIEPARLLPGAVYGLVAVGYLAAVLAAGNLALRWRSGRGGRRALWVTAWIAAAWWLSVAGAAATAGLVAAPDPGPAAAAGGALLAGVAVFTGAARAAEAGGWVAAAAAAAMVAVALAAGRVVALAWPALALVAVATVVAGLAGLIWLAGLVRPAGRGGTGAGDVTGEGPVGVAPPAYRGRRIGGLVAVGAAGGYAAGATLWGAAALLGGAAGGGPGGWQLPAAVVLLTAGLAGLLPAARPEVVAGGVALLALAVPAALTLPHRATLPVVLVAAAALGLAAVRARTVRRVVGGDLLAAGLAGYALAVALTGQGIDAAAGYAAGTVLGLTALGLLRAPVRRWWWLAVRIPVAALALVPAVPQLAAVLVGPYSWLVRPWSGPPAGAAVDGGWPGSWAGPVSLPLLAAATLLAGRALSGRWRPAGPAALVVSQAALLVSLAQFGAPWPVVPAVSLALGVAGVLAAALGRLAAPAAGVTGGYGLALAGAGLGGALAARWSTLVALAVAVVVASVVGAAGRTAAGRVLGWVGAVLFAVLLAVAGPLAADLPLSTAAYLVLGVSAAAAGATRWLRPRDSVALEAAAHGGAAVALLLALGSSGAAGAALVAALWGLVLGGLALRRGPPAGGRVGRAVAAAGGEALAWCLLLASWRVVAVEAYTLPAAAFALLAGWWVRRSRRQVGSWIGYGPALAAAAMPSFYLTLVDPAPLRRLLLGAAAVAVLAAGARWRLQAPVVIGGATAALVAVRELAVVWQYLDAWIPLTVAGLLLVGLAATYERRRRDLARLHAALRRMA